MLAVDQEVEGAKSRIVSPAADTMDASSGDATGDGNLQMQGVGRVKYHFRRNMTACAQYERERLIERMKRTRAWWMGINCMSISV